MSVDVNTGARTDRLSSEAGVSMSIDANRIATILIDQAGTSVNVMNMAFIEELEQVVSDLPADLTGLIVASGKPDQFVAGADLEQLLQARTPQEPAEAVRRLHRVLNRLAGLPYPSVAAINGPALGGGLELALACDYRVCVESRSPMLGLPEVQLGLLPAGGGTQRLPRLIGLSRALSLILEGKRYTPDRAKKYGVVDEIVHPSILQTATLSFIRRGKRHGVPHWSRIDKAAQRWPLVRSVMYRQANQRIRKKTGAHYPAPLKALDTIRAGQEQGFGAGLAAEAVAFGELATGTVARNLIQLFFATEALKKQQRSLSSQAQTVDHLGVVGAGFMGAGIAQAAATTGAMVRLRDVQVEQVARGIKVVRDVTMNAARKGRFSRQEAQDIVSRITGTTDFTGFRRAQLVIEAVFEDLEIKRQVIAQLEELLEPQAVIASNTSSLPIGSLAAGALHPERIIGMHFFSPVHRMPLLEVVRAHQTSERTVATAVEIGHRMGKTVIVVNDGPGFYTTRVLGFMMQEASHVFEQGAAIEEIDSAMTAFGFPIGPIALTDEVGLDVAAHVAGVLHDAFPRRFRPSSVISAMVQDGRLGRKSKAGFYDYRGKRKKVDPRVRAMRNHPPAPIARDLIQRRLVLMLINEAVRCLEEDILGSPRDGDVGAIMGFGFPPFLGGPFRYADTLGIASVVEQLHQMEYAYGPQFEPAPLLTQMKQEARDFYA